MKGESNSDITTDIWKTNDSNQTEWLPLQAGLNQTFSRTLNKCDKRDA